MSTIDASAPAWSCPRSSTCIGVHGMCRRTRPGLWWSGVISSFSHVPAKQAVRSGRCQRSEGREQGVLGSQARRPSGVVGGLVDQQAPADRVACPGGERHVEEGQVAASPQDPRLRHHVLLGCRREVLHGEIDAAQVGRRVEIHAGPGRQCPGHGQERGARTAIQDTACVHVLETIRQHDDGAIGCHLADGEAQTCRKGIPGKPCSRLLETPGACRACRHGDAGSHPTMPLARTAVVGSKLGPVDQSRCRPVRSPDVAPLRESTKEEEATETPPSAPTTDWVEQGPRRFAKAMRVPNTFPGQRRTKSASLSGLRPVRAPGLVLHRLRREHVAV